tara:strand:+ start:47 stop:376 length:330 start_codon:yes stop_codon:yes gene_type:complete
MEYEIKKDISFEGNFLPDYNIQDLKNYLEGEGIHGEVNDGWCTVKIGKGDKPREPELYLRVKLYIKNVEELTMRGKIRFDDNHSGSREKARGILEILSDYEYKRLRSVS